jgi:hypothetical protein
MAASSSDPARFETEAGLRRDRRAKSRLIQRARARDCTGLDRAQHFAVGRVRRQRRQRWNTAQHGNRARDYRAVTGFLRVLDNFN